MEELGYQSLPPALNVLYTKNDFQISNTSTSCTQLHLNTTQSAPCGSEVVKMRNKLELTVTHPDVFFPHIFVKMFR